MSDLIKAHQAGQAILKRKITDIAQAIGVDARNLAGELNPNNPARKLGVDRFIQVLQQLPAETKLRYANIYLQQANLGAHHLTPEEVEQLPNMLLDMVLGLGGGVGQLQLTYREAVSPEGDGGEEITEQEWERIWGCLLNVLGSAHRLAEAIKSAGVKGRS